MTTFLLLIAALLNKQQIYERFVDINESQQMNGTNAMPTNACSEFRSEHRVVAFAVRCQLPLLPLFEFESSQVESICSYDSIRCTTLDYVPLFRSALFSGDTTSYISRANTDRLRIGLLEFLCAFHFENNF